MSTRVGMTAHEYREDLEERCQVLEHQRDALVVALDRVLVELVSGPNTDAVKIQCCLAVARAALKAVTP